MVRIVQQTLHHASIQSVTELLVDVVRILYALVHMHMAYNANHLEKNHKKENHWLQSFLSVAIGQVSDI